MLDSPSNLRTDHPQSSTLVITRNTDEFAEVRQWCIDKLKGDPMIKVPSKFPIAISAFDHRAGWTDHLDRAAPYIETAEFFKQNPR